MLYYVFAWKRCKGLCLIACSLANIEKAAVLLCARSNMMKNHVFYCGVAWNSWCLISCIVFSLKKHYKVLLRIVFVRTNSPNHCTYRCNFLPYQKQHTCLTFMGKQRVKWNGPLRSGGAGHHKLFTLCVCFCVPPLWTSMRTLLGLRPLLGKKLKMSFPKASKPTWKTIWNSTKKS